MTSINCPLLNNDTKHTFDNRYASNIVQIRDLYPNPDYSLFSNPSKCFYGYGHLALVGAFVNYSFNFEEYFNVVKDDNQGIANIINYIKNNSRNDLRFVATDVKNSSLKFYYLKTDETLFKKMIEFYTNPIFSYMKLKAELTDYVLNYNQNGVKLGDKIENILDTVVSGLNFDLQFSSKYDEWYKPKLYKKGGLAIKHLWTKFKPGSDSPYLDINTVNQLTKNNSDYDVTVLFEKQFNSQKEYTRVIHNIFMFISTRIRDEYKPKFDSICDLLNIFKNGISIQNIKNIYDTLPQSNLGVYSDKNDIYIKLEYKYVKVKGVSCVNNTGEFTPHQEKSYNTTFRTSWNEKWNRDNKKRPIEFKLNLSRIGYPSYSDSEKKSCDPSHLKNTPICFTLFRCMGTCKVVEQTSMIDSDEEEQTSMIDSDEEEKKENVIIKKSNFEILDISVDCDYEKINLESKLEIDEHKMNDAQDTNITLGFSSLLYDLYNVIISSNEELQKAEKRCTRLKTMMVIYDKLVKEGRSYTVNDSFFGYNNNKKFDFVNNYARFCNNSRDTTKFNEKFITEMSFEDLSNFFKNLTTTPVNFNLRRMISHTIKTLPGLENGLEQIKIHFNPQTNPIFLQGGVKMLVLLDTLIQKYPICQRIKDNVTPIDFDYFTFYDLDEYPASVIEKFSNYKDYHKPLIRSNDEWINPNHEQAEIIRVHKSIEYYSFSLDANTNTPYNIYNNIDAGYYNPDAIKISRPYVVCSKKTFSVCKNNSVKISDFNLVELNIVNINWLNQILLANRTANVEADVLYLQSVYGFIHNYRTQTNPPTDEFLENAAFLLSSYMNYVYHLKPINSLLRFLVASLYMIENGFNIKQLFDIFEDFKRYLINMGHTPLKIKLSSNNSTAVVEHTFDDNATIKIRSETTKVPFNPFKEIFNDPNKIIKAINELVSQYTDKTLAEDAYVLDKRCEAN